MHSAALAHWLHLLWGPLPPLQLAPPEGACFIASGHIHLPSCGDWHAQRAAAAHAAAHLVYSPLGGFVGDGLVPIARVVLATLEDARVEALAMRELPGLARLWRRQHTATPERGEAFEALLDRLARALIDPAYEDPHAWVRKGRRLFYVDANLGMLALRTPAELRAAAMALGHDIGQTRLPFNARGHRPQPGYHDDHRWMWSAEQQQPPPQPMAPPPTPTLAQAGGSPQAALPPAAPPPTAPSPAKATRHPEWDRLIQRLRPDWVTVFEAPAEAPPLASAPGPTTAVALPHTGRLLPALQRFRVTSGGACLTRNGLAPDLDAVIAWRMARQAGGVGDARLFRTRRPRPARATVWLLVDQSASAADPANGPDARGGGPAGARLIDVASDAVMALATALRRLRVPVAVSAFSSHGRHAVKLCTVQALDEAPLGDTALRARLQGLCCGGSTRVGPVLRHAVQQMATRRGTERWLLVLSDAQAHDLDVHDPHYLPADARHAARDAARRGVKLACLLLGPSAPQRCASAPRAPTGAAPDHARAAGRIFGRHAVQALPSADALPRALKRLWAGPGSFADR